MSTSLTIMPDGSVLQGGLGRTSSRIQRPRSRTSRSVKSPTQRLSRSLKAMQAATTHKSSTSQRTRVTLWQSARPSYVRCTPTSGYSSKKLSS